MFMRVSYHKGLIVPPLPGSQTGHVSGGGIFSEILVGDTKGGIQCLAVVQWVELVEAGQFFLNELQK